MIQTLNSYECQEVHGGNGPLCASQALNITAAVVTAFGVLGAIVVNKTAKYRASIVPNDDKQAIEKLNSLKANSSYAYKMIGGITSFVAGSCTTIATIFAKCE
jgi:hypothetical protein